MARPQGQQIQQGVPGQVLGQQLQQGQQIVRTSSGQILVQQGGMAQQRGQVLQQQQAQAPVGQTAVIRQQLPQVPQNQAGIQRVVINQPGIRPGQPGSQITVPLSTLQALQAGQGIPTGQPGHLLVKTETGQYQILRVGPPGQGGNTTTATPVSVPQSLTGQPSPSPVRPQLAAASPSPQPRLPTAPVARQQVAQPAAAAAAANSANSMGQQMTPDTAKIKCKNFLATLLRLASDQPESVARNVRALIQVLLMMTMRKSIPKIIFL
jgi:transcription initiation factor TFIID subunit 4